MFYFIQTTHNVQENAPEIVSNGREIVLIRNNSGKDGRNSYKRRRNHDKLRQYSLPCSILYKRRIIFQKNSPGIVPNGRRIALTHSNSDKEWPELLY